MASFSESLTVRILGDSSHLQRELEMVSRRITEFQTRLSQFTGANQRIGRVMERFSGMIRPLRAISRLFDRIAEQASSLGRIPITLNVAPAMNSLLVLSGLIDSIAAKLRALSSLSLGQQGGAPQPGFAPIRQFAEGGLVTGPSGRDRVPALLTAGEFVLRQPVVQELGGSFLNALNQALSPGGSTARQAISNRISQEQSHVNHLGGITINVTQAADVNAIVRDLRFQGFRLRNRRG